MRAPLGVKEELRAESKQWLTGGQGKGELWSVPALIVLNLAEAGWKTREAFYEGIKLQLCRQMPSPRLSMVDLDKRDSHWF